MSLSAKVKAFVFAHLSAKQRQRIWLKKVGVTTYCVNYSFSTKVCFGGTTNNVLWEARSAEIDGQEAGVVKWLVKNQEHFESFVDIGANMGFFSVLASEIIKVKTLVSVEPSEYLEAWLSHNMARYPSVRWIALRKFVGAKTGGDTIALDDLERLTGIAGFVPDVIKIDVDGAETGILRGASKVLSNTKTCWLIEVHPTDLPSFNSTVDEFLSLIPRDHNAVKYLYGLREKNVVWTDEYVEGKEDFFVAIVPKRHVNSYQWS